MHRICVRYEHISHTIYIICGPPVTHHEHTQFSEQSNKINGVDFYRMPGNHNILPALGQNSRGHNRVAKSYVPKMWDEFYAVKTDVALDDEHVFRVYLSAPPIDDGPLLVLLHGGGYSALTWSHFTVGVMQIVCS